MQPRADSRRKGRAVGVGRGRLHRARRSTRRIRRGAAGVRGLRAHRPRKRLRRFFGPGCEGQDCRDDRRRTIQYPGASQSALPKRSRAQSFSFEGGRGGDGHHPKSQHVGCSLEPHHVGPLSGVDGTGRSSAGACQWAQDRGGGESGACRKMAGRLWPQCGRAAGIGQRRQGPPAFSAGPVVARQNENSEARAGVAERGGDMAGFRSGAQESICGAVCAHRSRGRRRTDQRRSNLQRRHG